jgi:hypothetical protein
MRSPSLVFACASLCAAGQVSAAEWSAAPLASWSMDHNSNPLLVENGGSSQSGILQLDLTLKRATPTTLFSLQPHAGWQRYTNDVRQNTSNQSVSASGMWLGDRSVLSTRAAWIRDDTLNNEIADTGAFTGTTQRRTKMASMAWTADQSSVSQFQAQFNYSDVVYEYERFFDFLGLQIPLQSLYAYKYPTLSLTETRTLSGRTSLQFNVYGGRLMMVDDASPDSDSYGASLGWTHSLTARLKVYLSAGVSRQVTDGVNNDGYIGSFELTWQDARGQWRLFANRDVAPGAYGFLVTQDDAGLSFERRLTPRWSGSLALRSLSSEDITPTLVRQRRRYDRAEAGLNWRATESWRLRGAVILARARPFEAAPISTSWSTLLQAIWSPQPSTLSR